MEAAGIAFWLFLGLTGYVYAGYPVLLALWCRIRRGPEAEPGWRGAEEAVLPKVSLIIPAYNEEQVIVRKIRNSLEVDYPAHLLEIVVVSDGSSDSTEALARQAAGERVRLVFLEDRQGKTACINAVLPGLLGAPVGGRPIEQVAVDLGGGEFQQRPVGPRRGEGLLHGVQRRGHADRV